MSFRNTLLSLIGLFIIGLNSPSAFAHPPDEHDPVAVSQETETTSENREQADHHDDPNAPPHDHGTATPTSSMAEQTDHAHDPTAAHDTDASSDDHGHAQAHDHGTGQADALDPCAGADDHHGDSNAPSDGHSHWGDDGPKTPFERALAKLGVFHAVAVHFPIALILAAALAQALNMARDEQAYADIVRFLVWTGAVGGLVAGFFGWAHSGPMASNEAGVMLTHRWLGTGLALGLFGVVAAVEWRRRNPSALPSLVLNISVFGAAAAVALNGFLGGSLAHGGLRHLMGG